jgi:hypothetical protein
MPRPGSHRLTRTSIRLNYAEPSATQIDTPRKATVAEIEQCRRIAGPLSAPVWIALTVGALERFAFYSISTPWRESTPAPTSARMAQL